MRNIIVIMMSTLMGGVFFSCQMQPKDLADFGIGSPILLQDFSEIFDSIELVFLEKRDDAMLKKRDKLYVLDTAFIIYEFADATHVYMFDKTGRFIRNTRDLIGQGEQYLNSVTDFLYNRRSGYMEFLDPRGFIRIYDLQNNFIQRIRLPEPLVHDKYLYHRFQVLPDSMYMFYYMDPQRPFLQLYSLQNKQIVFEEDMKESFSGRNIAADPHVFFEDSRQVYFAASSQGYVLYRINTFTPETPLEKAYVFEFLDNPLPAKLKRDLPDEMLLKYDALTDKSISDKYLHIGYSYGKTDLASFFYNRQNGRSICIQYKTRHGDCIFQVDYMDNEYCYFVAPPTWIGKMFPSYPFDDTTRLRINALSDDDNNVIIKYRFKKGFLED